MTITQESIYELIEEYVSDKLYDYWDIAAKIINDIYPRENCEDDAQFYFHVHAIWGIVDDYARRNLDGVPQ
jgi:hypothetical protein